MIENTIQLSGKTIKIISPDDASTTTTSVNEMPKWIGEPWLPCARLSTRQKSAKSISAATIPRPIVPIWNTPTGDRRKEYVD